MKNLMLQLKELFRRDTPQEAGLFELAEAEMALLKAETGVEYAQAAVMYNKSRVKRLKAYVNAPTEEKTV